MVNLRVPLIALLIAIIVLSSPTAALNILLIAPGWSSSHVLFNFRIAKTLLDRGHNVTILLHEMTTDLPLRNAPDGADLIRFVPSDSESIRKSSSSMFRGLAWRDADLAFFREMNSNFRVLVHRTCEEILNDHELLDELRSRRFDVTLSHFFQHCTQGWSHRLGIEKFVLVATGAFIFENVAYMANLPNLPSYMPSHLTQGCSDRMSFRQRLINAAWSAMLYTVMLEEQDYFFWIESESTIFRRAPYDSPRDKGLWQLGQETATILINGEPFLDFARPMLPGMTHMGEMQPRRVVKKLPEDWQKLMDESKEGAIIFSFGTVANTTAMPFELKEAFFNAFVKFPDYTIIWRLEGRLPADLDKYPHIRLVEWFPQSDLLHHDKMKLFITHGGYNSYLESSQAGVPMVLMPLLIDQYANAERAKQKGIGLSLDKRTATSQSIEGAMRTVLTDPSFAKNARYLSAVLKDQIIPNELLALHTIEKLTRTGRLWPTMKAARRLGFLQYFCLDVAAVLIGIVLTAIYAIWKFCTIIWRAIQNHKKQRKMEK